MSLEGSTPSPSALDFEASLAERFRHRSFKPDRRVRLPRDALGDRLTGRLLGFEPGGGGSNPPPRITDLRFPMIRGSRRWWRRRVLSAEAAGSIPAPGTREGRPGTPTGRAARLKTGCMWVQIPPRVSISTRSHPWLGRQLADHSRSDREMLRVRIPPEPLFPMPSRSSLECSPPCQGGDRGFKSHRGRWMFGRMRHGTPTGRAAKLKPW